MIAFFFRLATLVALMMLPLSMGAAAHGQGMTAAHCSHDKPMKAPAGDCAMACASTLPATPAAVEERPLSASLEHGHPALTARLHGLILDIATPPPRIA